MRDSKVRKEQLIMWPILDRLCRPIQIEGLEALGGLRRPWHPAASNEDLSHRGAFADAKLHGFQILEAWSYAA